MSTPMIGDDDNLVLPEIAEDVTEQFERERGWIASGSGLFVSMNSRNVWGKGG